MAQVIITAVATLLAVGLGGWLTTRAQERLWRRDQHRQWRDIRLTAYTEFLTAFRQYVSYVLLPTAKITTTRRKRSPNDLMPYFDKEGTAYKERLEATKTALRLVSGHPAVVEASREVVRLVRLLAADRAVHGIEGVPDAQFDALWAAEREFITAARAELGLTGLRFDNGRGSA